MSPIDRKERKRAKTEAEAAAKTRAEAIAKTRAEAIAKTRAEAIAKAKAEAMSSRSDQSENPALRALVDKLEGTKLDEPKISASPPHKVAVDWTVGDLIKDLTDGPKEHLPLIGVKHLCPEIEEGLIGTTCAAIIGSTAIYLAADGRASSTLNKGLIVSGNEVKIFEISKHIFAAVAGRSDLALDMVHAAKIAVKSVEYGVEEAIVRAKNAVIGFQKQCEARTSMLLCGTVNQEKTVFAIIKGEVSVVKGLRSYGTIGGGGPIAAHYLKKTVDKCFYDKDYYYCLKESLTYSSLFVGCTGGEVLGVRSGRRVLRFYEREHVVRCLQNRLKVFLAVFHKSLSRIIFCTTNSMIYDLKHEANVESYVKTVFASVDWFHVFGVDLKERLIVRVLGFETVDAKISGLKRLDEVEGNLVPEILGAQLTYETANGESHKVSFILPEDFINRYQDNSFDY